MPLQFDSGREQFGISTRPPAIAGCTSLFPTAGPWRQHNKLGNLHSLPRPLSLFVFQPPSVASGSFSCFSRLTACVLLSCLFCSALVLLLLPRFSSLVLCPPFACHLPEVLSACFPPLLVSAHLTCTKFSVVPWTLSVAPYTIGTVLMLADGLGIRAGLPTVVFCRHDFHTCKHDKPEPPTNHQSLESAAVLNPEKQ